MNQQVSIVSLVLGTSTYQEAIEVSRALATRTHNATLKVLEDGKPITLSPTPDSAEWVAALNKAIRV